MQLWHMLNADMTQGSLTHAPCTDSHSFIEMQFLCISYTNYCLFFIREYDTNDNLWKLKIEQNDTNHGRFDHFPSFLKYHSDDSTRNQMHIDDSIKLIIFVRTWGRMAFGKDRGGFSRNTFDEFQSQSHQTRQSKKIPINWKLNCS